jgi:methionyl-tRNA synthetase
MSDKTFYLSTPIYYTNGIPHIGHAYSSIIADVIARFERIHGKEVKFSTGVDENSQKIVQKAGEEWVEINTFLDTMAAAHKAVWDGLHLEYTDFVRTTEARHHELVRKVLAHTWEKWDIYPWEYEGLYCVWCEAFKKDDDLIERDGKKVCPDHLKEPERLKEKNYFFRLSKYQDKLVEFYKSNPDFVTPKERFNEVIAFVERGLEDFSISRETNKFWIKLPFDESQVTYVWYDALLNYVTVCEGEATKFWPANLHIVGKDIIRFHAIYWPAMLMAADLELPRQVLTTGFFTVDGQKISKSLGNVIDPVAFIEKYNKDLLVMYLLSSFHIGQDGDFSEKEAVLTYNAKLANNLGNLVNRVVVLSLKLWWILEESVNWEVASRLEQTKTSFYGNFERYVIKDALDEVFTFLDTLNKYVDEKAPWTLIKDELKHPEVKHILYTVAESIRVVGLLLYPFFPEKMSEMFVKLGLQNYDERLKKWELKNLLAENVIFHIKEKGEALFQRIEV